MTEPVVYVPARPPLVRPAVRWAAAGALIVFFGWVLREGLAEAAHDAEVQRTQDVRHLAARIDTLCLRTAHWLARAETANSTPEREREIARALGCTGSHRLPDLKGKYGIP